jgi:hypothetical protein
MKQYKNFFIKDTLWGKKGYKTIRITNNEVFDGSFVDRFNWF